MNTYTNTNTKIADEREINERETEGRENQTISVHSSRSFPRPEADDSPTSKPALFNEGVSSQFNILVVISTFTAALIVSFLSLVDQLVDIQGSVAREIGMWLAFLACGVHLWVAIVAGRVALLVVRPRDLPESSQRLTKTDFARFLVLCEQLQLAGTIIFAPAALILIQKVFTRIWFGVSLYIIAAVSVVLIFRAGFWKGSVLAENFMEFGRMAGHLSGHVN